MSRSTLFSAIRPHAPNQRFTPEMVKQIDGLADMMGMAREGGPLTARGAAELVAHEAIVREAYRDSVGVWTWSIGLTAAAGIDPLKYKDKPAPLEDCLAAFINRCNAIYIPAVLKAFGSKALSEAQFAAALSFHYNTGAIDTADWVKKWIAGDVAGAKSAFMNWSKPASIIERRTKERDLFFDGKWSNDGTALVYLVAKPSYQPVKPVRRDIRTDIAKAMGA